MPETNLDLASIRTMLDYGVVGTNEHDVEGATIHDVVDAAYELLNEVERLSEP